MMSLHKMICYTEVIIDYGPGNGQALLHVYVRSEHVWNVFGRAAVAPYSFMDILTGTPKVSGSTLDLRSMRVRVTKTLILSSNN